MLLLLGTASPGHCGKKLDDILNNQRMGPNSTERMRDDSIAIAPGQTVRQTFSTGPTDAEISRIAISIPWWVEDWSADESVALSLADASGAETLSSAEMKYEWREWEDQTLVFPVGVAVKPSTKYSILLSVNGGDGKVSGVSLASQNYPDGEGFSGSAKLEKDIFFQVYVRPPLDRDAVYQNAFSNINLDYPPLAKVKKMVEARQWDEACRLLVQHFESRTDLIPPKDQRVAKRDPSYDRKEADLNADQKLTAADGKIIDLGPDWNLLKWWDTRGGVGLTRGGLRKPLAGAYEATGDEKFARAFNDMLISQFTNIPSPIEAGIVPRDAKEITPINAGGLAGGSMWAGLSTGARMGHGFAYYVRFVDSPYFEMDTRAAFIFDLAFMANMLSAQKGGGNWATQMTDALFSFGQEYPEFKRSKEWFSQGLNGLIANLRETVRDDGPIGESMAYQTLTLGRYYQLLQKAKQFGIDLPEDVRGKVEGGYQFMMYTMLPDFTCPPCGDANRMDIRQMLTEAYNEFKRPDFIWVATEGKDGTPPASTSYSFPISGYFVMRDRWGSSGNHLQIKNSRYTAHGHRDSLSVMIYAHGRRMVIDPGIYIYGTPEAMRLNETRSHSTVQVDGKDLTNGGGPNYWQSGSNIDFYSGTGPEYEGLKQVRPVRSIIFRKPDLWVINDRVEGGQGRKIDIRFHFAGETPVRIDHDYNGFRTKFADGPNLALISPLSPKRLKLRLETGDDAVEREKLLPASIGCFTYDNGLEVSHQTVVVPYQDWSSESKTVYRFYPDNTNSLESAVHVVGRNGSDIFVFGKSDSAEVSFKNGQLKLAGRSGWIGLDKAGNVKGFAVQDGRMLSYKGQVLLNSQRVLGLIEKSFH